MSALLSPLDAIAERVGLDPASETLVVALTHSSYASEHDCQSNERLEFLGDAVVDLAVADIIIRQFPQLDEGSGSLVRSRVVNERSLAAAAVRLEIPRFLRVGRGVVKENGTQRPSLLADAFEALVAALYLERGFEAARAFVADALFERIAEAAEHPSEIDPKTRLRQWAEARGHGEPQYSVVAHGPSHDVTFTASVVVGGVTLATGSARSKKAAEASAAARALEEGNRARTARS